jgi:methionine synthase / methylenetetrahydrofolate reductase(NADPH)
MPRPRTLAERLEQNVVLGDGALGTMIYSRGVFINRCYDELNLAQPDIIRGLHQEYLAAGAEIIETNTFGANVVALGAHGLAERAVEINRRGAEIAREAVGDKDVLVAGSMGPTGMILQARGGGELEMRAAFAAQARALADGGVDLLILETFYSLDELLLALGAVKAAVKLPVIAQLTFDPQERAAVDAAGTTPAVAARRLADAGADVVGTNCGAGPAVLLRIVEEIAGAVTVPVSVFANAGLPEAHGGRLMCLGTSPEYMAEYARRFAQAGAKIVGGCCGTTPAMIGEMAVFLKGMAAARRSTAMVETTVERKLREPVPFAQRSRLSALLARDARTGRKLISVELSPPMGTDVQKALRGARLLKDGGVDVVNIPDGPRATPRMSPMALAQLVKDSVGIETIVHYCCRDRNTLGMQMDLLGAHALGLHNLMLITGDPPKIGNVQTATPVFDIDAIGLISMVDGMNRGMGLGGIDLGGQTAFVLGAGCNPGAVDVAKEAARFAKKAEAGAEYFFSQPVYQPELLDRFLELVKPHAEIPFFAGILPLASLRNAEFLHNEVPGMQIPDEIMERLRKAATREAQQREGIRIAQEMVQAAAKDPRISGLYLFPPFGRYELVLEVLEVL